MPRKRQEIILNDPEQAVYTLAELNNPSKFAQELLLTPFSLSKHTLQKSYGVFIPDEEYTPTYFFPTRLKRQIEKITGEKLARISGVFLPQINSIVIFESGNEIADSHRFFHEQTHSFSNHVYVTTEGQTLFYRVGYLNVGNKQGKSYRHGEFLEESVIDHLAHLQNVEFWRGRGRDIRSEKPVQKKDVLQNHVFMNIALQHLFSLIGAQNERLLVQARFNPEIRPKLINALNREFGVNAGQALLRLGTENLPEIARVIESTFEKVVLR